MNKDHGKEVEADQASSANIDEPFYGFSSFQKFYESYSNQIKETVADSAKLVSKQSDLDYLKTLPNFKSHLEEQNQRILKIIGTVLKQQGVKRTNINSVKLDDEERMDLLVDVNDQIIEKLGIQLDEIQGLRKKTETEIKLGQATASLQVTSRNIPTSWNRNIGMVLDQSKQPNTSSGSLTANKNGPGSLSDINKKASAIQKSQRLFKDKIDNSELPFVPKIRQKPNALVPLPDVFAELDKVEINQALFDENPELLENPYGYEIDQFNPDIEAGLKQEPVKPLPLDETPYKYIETQSDLEWLCDYLGKENRSKVKEISVDLEHHSYRSYLGFTCLMQISTRDHDFIVDTLKLREHMHLLNTVFTDWTLTKVLHGSDFDIEWLQKDFGIYVVNMFDTGQATRVLQYPHFSLSYLLQKHCNVQAQKQYQRADWRERPLPEEMINYARDDTHYLLYIYDVLRQELAKSESDDSSESKLKKVFEKSSAICRKVYKKPALLTKGFLTLCQNNMHLNSRQLKALYDLYKWRDQMARETDESCEYVLKNHQLLKIAELLPREIYGILALCDPLSHVVQTSVHEMHEIIKKAYDFKGVFTISDIINANQQTKLDINIESLAKPNNNFLDSVVQRVDTFDPNNLLNCAHDFPHQHFDEEEMHVDAASTQDIHFFKPNQVKLELPDNMVHVNVKLIIGERAELKNTSKKVLEKVDEIKKSIRSPFELYLPADLRRTNVYGDSEHWTLIKPEETVEKVVLAKNSEALVAPVVLKSDELNMIPIKMQIKAEKKDSSDKKIKKILKKSVDFTDAIIKFNKTKNQVNALGAEDEMAEANETEEFSEFDQKLRDNLKSLSETVKKQDESMKKQRFVGYETNSMNQMFKSAAAAGSSGGKDKGKRAANSSGKITKRRQQTNPLTRSSNNQSFSFKKN